MDTQTSVAGNIRSGGGYITVGGVRTYYEVTGTGEPLLLLHGGLMTAESWDPQVSTLAQHCRVYVLEQLGHGRTPDIDGPLTYETMAQHATAFLDALGISSAHLCGWSDGALVALLVALRRPSLARKIVHVDCFITLDDAPAGYLDFIRAMTADTAPPQVVQAYAALSPDGPEHFPVVFNKLHRTWTEPTGLEVADLAKITAPTLVLAADDGAMPLEHLAAVRRTLPDCQTAVVPGTSHGVAMEKPHIVNQLIIDFLADVQAPKLFSHDGP